MTKLLLRIFVKDARSERARRAKIGKLAGIIGIITNLILAGIKLLLGGISGSIAIVSDGVNNLTDSASSIITLIGFKLAAKERDSDHPFGHSRIEYLAGILISVIIIVVGFEMLRNSFFKILNPEEVKSDLVVISILVIAIFIKLWQSRFYHFLAKEIDSTTLKATGTDSRNDVLITISVLVAMIILRFTEVNLDGWFGAFVAIFIIYSGVALIREVADPLLGKTPDGNLVKAIEDLIAKRSGVLGMHDLVVHEYGPNVILASVHVEVDAKVDILTSHETIDNIEKEAYGKLGIELVCHLDPVDTADPLIDALREDMLKALWEIEGVKDAHDFRIVRGEGNINVIFDVAISIENSDIKSEIAKIARTVLDDIRGQQQIKQTLSLVLTYDFAYNDISPSR